MNKPEILRAVAGERRNLIALLRTLDAEQWEIEVLPGWRPREVAAHVIRLDITSLTGSLLPIAFRNNMARLERWNDDQVPKWANRPTADLLTGLDRWGRRFLRLARTVPAPAYRLRVPTLWGKAPAGLLIWSRAFDEWVHRHDIRRALGMPDEEVDVAPAAEFVLTAAISETVAKMAGQRGRVAISLEGVRLPEWEFDIEAGRGGPVGSLDGEATPHDEPDARLTLPAHSFVIAATGRDSFEDLRSDGTLQVEGDEALAESFLSKLRIV